MSTGNDVHASVQSPQETRRALQMLRKVTQSIQSLGPDLTAIAALTGEGYLERTGTSTWALRKTRWRRWVGV